MANLNHLKGFNESDENLDSELSNTSDGNKELTVRVKHIIQYLTENFDPEATVHLDKDGWMSRYLDATDEIDLIKKRAIFENYKGNLFINN